MEDKQSAPKQRIDAEVLREEVKKHQNRVKAIEGELKTKELEEKTEEIVEKLLDLCLGEAMCGRNTVLIPSSVINEQLGINCHNINAVTAGIRSRGISYCPPNTFTPLHAFMW